LVDIAGRSPALLGECLALFEEGGCRFVVPLRHREVAQHSQSVADGPGLADATPDVEALLEQSPGAARVVGGCGQVPELTDDLPEADLVSDGPEGVHSLPQQRLG
jgi:hypothetical protein